MEEIEIIVKCNGNYNCGCCSHSLPHKHNRTCTWACWRGECECTETDNYIRKIKLLKINKLHKHGRKSTV